MMKVLVIPDVHLKPWIFSQAAKLMKDRVLILDQEIRMETDPFAGLYPILDKEGEH